MLNNFNFMNKKPYFKLFETLENFNRNTLRLYYPDYLYKFLSLDDNDELNKLKFNTLLSKSIYFSKIEQLNDPFEFLSMTAVEERLKLGNETFLLSLNRLLSEFKNNRFIACFTNSIEDNIAMWAHYTNNHKGFCCKYRIVSKKADNLINFSKVAYSKHPFYLDRYHLNLQLAGSFSSSYMKKNELRKIQVFNLMYNNLLCSYKHISWSYENEYRIHQIIDNESKDVKGQNVPLSKINLELTDIYAGIKCKHIRKLKNIAKKLNVSFHVMKIADNDYFLNFK